MNDFDNKISALIQDQFPEFYLQEGPNFIAFMQAYYEWLEQEQNPLGNLRSLLSYNDVDTTLDQFIVHFKNKYLYNIQFNIASNPRLFLKHSLDFYRSKGTPRAVDLFFRLIYGLSAEVYYPGDDVFKLSDGQWIKPQYLEITSSPNNVSYIGQVITGLASGATAFVDRLVRRRVNSRYVDILYVSEIIGTFQISEVIASPNKKSELASIVGSLSSVDVIDGGQKFQIGNILDISSASGQQGVGVVSSVATQRGFVDFNLNFGGWGYSNTSNVIISEHVLSISDVTVNDTSRIVDFELFETVTSPMANIAYSSLNGNLASGQIINQYTGANISGTGTILNFTPANSTTGTLLVSLNKFANGLVSNLNSNVIFYTTGNTANATVVSYTDKTATANVMGISSNAQFIVDTVNGAFVTGEEVFQYIGNTVVGKAMVTTSDTSEALGIINVSNIAGIFIPSGQISGETIVAGIISTATANLKSISTSIGLFSTNNIFVNGSYVYGNTSNTTANVSSVSSGINADFGLASFINQEIDSLNTDKVSDINSGNISFLNVKVNGSNGNTGFANGYGFARMPSGNINTPLYQLLSYQQQTIGTIAAIGGINQGNNYTASPFVLVYNPPLAAMNLNDYVITTANSSLTFTVGEMAQQTIAVANSVVLSLLGAGAFSLGELIYQSNGTANVATGILDTNLLSGPSGKLILNTVNGTFTSAFSITGGFSNAIGYVTDISPYVTTAKGIVKSQTTPSTLYLQRISKISFDPTMGQIVGVLSGAATNIATIVPDSTTVIDGLNADVNANVVTGNGVITSIRITGSGFGFANNETATVITDNNNLKGLVRTNLAAVGVNEGYYISNKGFLSDAIYLFDGDFYQEYSYQIISKLPFEYYSSIIKKVLHVAGTRVFGGVEISSNTGNILTPFIPQNSNKVILTINNASNASPFLVGEYIYQSNGIPGYVANSVANTNTLPFSEFGADFTGITSIPHSGTIFGTGIVTNSTTAMITIPLANTLYLPGDMVPIGEFGTSTYAATGSEFVYSPYIVNTHISQPNNSVNAASGTVVSSIIDGANQIIWIANTSGTFISGRTVQGFVGNNITSTANVSSAINTVEIALVSGDFFVNSSANLVTGNTTLNSAVIIGISKEIG